MKRKLFAMCLFASACFWLMMAEGRGGTLRALESQMTDEVTQTGEATGERYRFIDDSQLSEATAESVKTRTYLYAGMTPVSMTENDQTLFIGTDIRGSIRTLTDRYGTVTARADYDEFGFPLTLDAVVASGLGYAGKPWNSLTQFYNFGFRDYSPVSGRFTSLDPIRYGFNWYAYVNNDPVNYVDMWGLINVKPVELSMQDERWGTETLGSSTEVNASLVKEKGCYLTGYASAAVTLTGDASYTPDYFNKQSALFDSSQNFNSNKASEITGLMNDYWTKANQGDLTEIISELNKSDTEYVVMAQVPYDAEGNLHWIELYGEADEDGWVSIVGTSTNDKNKNGLRGEITDVWSFTDNGVKVNASEIVQLRTFTGPAGIGDEKCGGQYHY